LLVEKGDNVMDTHPGSAMPAEMIIKMKAADSYPEEKRGEQL